MKKYFMHSRGVWHSTAPALEDSQSDGNDDGSLTLNLELEDSQSDGNDDGSLTLNLELIHDDSDDDMPALDFDLSITRQLTLTQREVFDFHLSQLTLTQRIFTWETSFQNIPYVTSQVTDDEGSLTLSDDDMPALEDSQGDGNDDGSLTLNLELSHDDSDDDMPALVDSQSDRIIVYSRQEH
jgi:hypothetical protein